MKNWRAADKQDRAFCPLNWKLHWESPILVTAALLAGAPAYAALDRTQPIYQNIQDAWDTESGLPQNTVAALARTSDGYLWVVPSLASPDSMAFDSRFSIRTTRPNCNRTTLLLYCRTIPEICGSVRKTVSSVTVVDNSRALEPRMG